MVMVEEDKQQHR